MAVYLMGVIVITFLFIKCRQTREKLKKAYADPDPLYYYRRAELLDDMQYLQFLILLLAAGHVLLVLASQRVA